MMRAEQITPPDGQQPPLASIVRNRDVKLTGLAVVVGELAMCDYPQ